LQFDSSYLRLRVSVTLLEFRIARRAAFCFFAESTPGVPTPTRGEGVPIGARTWCRLLSPLLLRAAARKAGDLSRRYFGCAVRLPKRRVAGQTRDKGLRSRPLIFRGRSS
jgi:hypothetical protein